MLRRISLVVLILCVSAAVAGKKPPYADPPMPPYRVESRGFNESALKKSVLQRRRPVKRRRRLTGAG
ncbi:MAG: hypothetical protein QGH60_23195 [Phycisphaerae bacterium]|nr:hypothetical protein [Phycisphaerae bacterium]